MKRRIPAQQVRQIVGISDMGLWRWLRDESLNFPKPIYIRKRRYWDADEIDQWQAARKA